ncbi:S-methyl-5-thioribose-1-phosphate isomerase [Alicyclobacillus pomorum]|uniref:S-methyl-5-thioribose-1-phosphate isomerase n=1 Tax=Alicyclobacillus pomorum TaxID=204470 RepID=UPI000478C030|nr:S-methyl-5-thioribose-1-phosphate isomerase [Alicyclobacillus pomorum]
MKALRWNTNTLEVLDQTALPHEELWISCDNAEDVAKTIVEMKVRGAPAIGAAAAFGAALEAQRLRDLSLDTFRREMTKSLERLGATRPTAVNLFWAIERMTKTLKRPAENAGQLADWIRSEAEQIALEDVATNRAIGRHGADLFDKPVEILTHCNTGSLATVDFGTALGVIRTLAEDGKLTHVWVDETRPYLQGARLTAYELCQDGIPHTLITDNMAAHFMKQGRVDAVIVGADRIARNGDTANKIGTYGLAVLCAYHEIPFYVAAPLSTFDLSIASGEFIPIEERSAEEVTSIRGHRISPQQTSAAHPAFDVTPHSLITGIITERGVIHAPTEERILTWMGDGKESTE